MTEKSFEKNEYTKNDKLVKHSRKVLFHKNLRIRVNTYYIFFITFVLYLLIPMYSAYT